MTCNRVQRRLSAFIEGDLSASEREDIAEHLKSCSVCAFVSDEYGILIRRLRDFSVAVPEGLLAQFRRRLYVEEGFEPLPTPLEAKFRAMREILASMREKASLTHERRLVADMLSDIGQLCPYVFQYLSPQPSPTRGEGDF